MHEFILGFAFASMLWLVVLSLVAVSNNKSTIAKCAEDCLSDKPSPAWRRALIDAQAKKDKEEIK